MGSLKISKMTFGTLPNLGNPMKHRHFVSFWLARAFPNSKTLASLLTGSYLHQVDAAETLLGHLPKELRSFLSTTLLTLHTASRTLLVTHYAWLARGSSTC